MVKTNLLGSWAFLIGVLLALLFGILIAFEVPGISLEKTAIAGTLVVLGLIIGALNVTGGESLPFLISGIALIVASVFGSGMMVQIPVVGSTLGALLLIFVPATILVSIKNVFSLAHK